MRAVEHDGDPVIPDPVGTFVVNVAGFGAPKASESAVGVIETTPGVTVMLTDFVAVV